MIRIYDLVRLKYTPAWGGVVMAIEADTALIGRPVGQMNWSWLIRKQPWMSASMPLDLLELVPGQQEVMAA